MAELQREQKRARTAAAAPNDFARPPRPFLEDFGDEDESLSDQPGRRDRRVVTRQPGGQIQVTSDAAGQQTAGLYPLNPLTCVSRDERLPEFYYPAFDIVIPRSFGPIYTWEPRCAWYRIYVCTLACPSAPHSASLSCHRTLCLSSGEMSHPEWTVADFIYRGRWWNNRGMFAIQCCRI